MNVDCCRLKGVTGGCCFCRADEDGKCLIAAELLYLQMTVFWKNDHDVGSLDMGNVCGERITTLLLFYHVLLSRNLTENQSAVNPRKREKRVVPQACCEAA